MNENKLEIRLLTADDIDVKVKQVTEKGAVLLLYKNARVDMRILDDTFGSMNWQDDYREIKGNLYCGIGIRESEEKPFVWKWDCGIESREDEEGNQKKGEASDSFKRAGFKWGIGRELYTAPFVFAKVDTIKDGNKFKLANPFEKFSVKSIDYVARKISKLVIVNSKNEVIYTLNSEKQALQAKLEQTPTTNTSSTKTPENAANNGEKQVCEQCGADVTDKVAKYSKDKYSKVLCFNCQKKPKVENKEVLEPIEDEDLPF